jgi:hypothetical protein
MLCWWANAPHKYSGDWSSRIPAAVFRAFYRLSIYPIFDAANNTSITLFVMWGSRSSVVLREERDAGEVIKTFQWMRI